MKSYRLRQASRRCIFKSTGQCISSWWMFCYTKPNSPLTRSTRPGPRMRKNSSGSTGVCVGRMANPACCNTTFPVYWCLQAFQWQSERVRNYPLTGWLVCIWVCLSLIDSDWTGSWEGKSCLAKNSFTDNTTRLKATKMFVFPCVYFRVDISDTLMYVYEMLGAELLSNLYDKLGRLLTNAEQPTSWQVGEKYTDKQKKTKQKKCIFCFFDCVAQKPVLKMCHPRCIKPFLSSLYSCNLALHPHSQSSH